VPGYTLADWVGPFLPRAFNKCWRISCMVKGSPGPQRKANEAQGDIKTNGLLCASGLRAVASFHLQLLR
jgi:hypothetical protein